MSPPSVSAFEPAIIAEITDALDPTAEGKVTVWTGRLFAFFPSWLRQNDEANPMAAKRNRQNPATRK